ncbi:trypsin-like serine protease [Paracoccaceae bacterium Fryx2]|nr:trypsin-like serine protease [Paracoccaceae bacterium Fryx2]
MRLILLLILCLGLGLPGRAQESPLRQLATGDDSRGWEGVGRLNLGRKGFCTGALIATDLVLTAAHCLFDKVTGARIDPSEIEFLAGWRNGRAAAYRGVRRAVAHPEYVYGGHEKLVRVAYDIALIQLDQPIRLPSITPFETDPRPAKGDEVGVVSYAQDRAEAPSLQEVCHVLGRQPGVLVLSCNVDFGSSGAPIFSVRDGVARVVSVVSAKAVVDGRQVALGTALEAPLEALRAELAGSSDGVFQRVIPGARLLSGSQTAGQTGGAKFLRPGSP